MRKALVPGQEFHYAGRVASAAPAAINLDNPEQKVDCSTPANIRTICIP